MVPVMGTDERTAVASAPGKCILFGEHAVVYGEPAVAVALEQRLSVRMSPSKSWSVNGSELSTKRHPHVHHMVNELWSGVDKATPLSIHVSGDIPRFWPWLKCGTQCCRLRSP